MSNPQNQKKTFGILTHLMVWGVLFSMPYLLSIGEENVLEKVVAHTWVPLLYSAIIFYINYFFLADKLFFNKKIVHFLIINTALIALFIWVKDIVDTQLFSDVFPPRPGGKDGPPFKLFVYVDIIRFSVPMIFSVGVKTAERWFKSEDERKEAANIKLQSELQHLKYQLQPHFFFNSLNTIYSLVDISPENAKTTIHSLGKLMRYLLYDTNEEKVSLKKEVEFMTKYIELMKLRAPEKTSVTYNFPKITEDIEVAPLLFISLVENAFKHGISASEGSHLSFEMTLEDHTIVFKTTNPNTPKTDTDKSGSGIGLVNLEKRLSILYPHKHELSTKTYDNLFVSTLSLQLK